MATFPLWLQINLKKAIEFYEVWRGVYPVTMDTIPLLS